MPQLEDGYVKIANELFEALIKFKLPGNELRIALFVIRKTYGFNKKSDWISNSQFVSGTGIDKSSVCRAINNLVLKKIVDKDNNKKTPTYRFNKNYWQWTLLTSTTTNSQLIKASTVVDKDVNSTFVDSGDNRNWLSNYSDVLKVTPELLTATTTGPKLLLSPLSPTKDSNNVTKDRDSAGSGFEQQKQTANSTLAKLKQLSAIAAGNFDHAIVIDYSSGNESFKDMQARAKRELEKLKRK